MTLHSWSHAYLHYRFPLTTCPLTVLLVTGQYLADPLLLSWMIPTAIEAVSDVASYFTTSICVYPLVNDRCRLPGHLLAMNLSERATSWDSFSILSQLIYQVTYYTNVHLAKLAWDCWTDLTPFASVFQRTEFEFISCYLLFFNLLFSVFPHY